MAAIFHFFLPVTTGQPPSEKYEELAFERVPLREGGHVRLSLMGSQELIGAIAVSVPSAVSEERRAEVLGRAVEHMLSILRLMYDRSIELLHTADGVLRFSTEDEAETPTWPVKMKFEVQPAHDANAYVKAWRISGAEPPATAIALLAESSAVTFPSHYRILSLIRALEHIFPRPEPRRDFLAAYEDAFTVLAISTRSLAKSLPEIRVRCAHGNPIGRGEARPFVGFGFQSPPEVDKLTQLLTKIVREAISSEYGVLFSELQPDEAFSVSPN